MIRRCSFLVAVALVPLALVGCASGGGAPEDPSPVVSNVQTEEAQADAREGGEETRRTAPSVRPGPPGTASRTLSDEEKAPGERLPYTSADVRFMQNMIHHHQQALEMSRLAPARTKREDILLLARRIDRSQDDEIRLMATWLRTRGEDVPELDAGHDDHHHHEHHHDAPDGPALMAGMLSPQQMGELAEARDETFDRLFLEFMIFHHEGALEMVEELFASPGAGQGSEIFQFASHVHADQQAEIARMDRMLRSGR